MRYTSEMSTKKLDPVHPGEILQKEFLEPMDLSQNRIYAENSDSEVFSLDI